MSINAIEHIPKLPEAFGLVRQVAYIVKDIDAAMDYWRTEHNIDAFLVTHNVSPLRNAYYRGVKSGKTPVHIAFAYVGEMQIELIELIQISDMRPPI